MNDFNLDGSILTVIKTVDVTVIREEDLDRNKIDEREVER